MSNRPLTNREMINTMQGVVRELSQETLASILVSVVSDFLRADIQNPTLDELGFCLGFDRETMEKFKVKGDDRVQSRSR